MMMEREQDKVRIPVDALVTVTSRVTVTFAL